MNKKCGIFRFLVVGIGLMALWGRGGAAAELIDLDERELQNFYDYAPDLSVLGFLKRLAETYKENFLIVVHGRGIQSATVWEPRIILRGPESTRNLTFSTRRGECGGWRKSFSPNFVTY